MPGLHGVTLTAVPDGGFWLSAYLRDGENVYRTCFTTGRGVDRLRFDLTIFDLTGLDRRKDWEDTPDGWPRTDGRFEVVRRHQPAEPA
ncbi:MAG: DUF899 family protein [Actinomycetota bacterium]